MHVRIDPATNAVAIDGQDVSPVIRRTTLDLHSGRQPEVFLELVSGAVVPECLDTDAVVHVVRETGEEVATKPIVLAWLGILDPGMIERMLLEDVDLETGMGQAVVNVLRKLADDLG